MCLFLAVLGLGCCTQAFSCRDKQGWFSGCGAQASHWGSCPCGAQAVGASVVSAHRFSCPAACGIFLDQGPNLCSLHYPLDYQGSPLKWNWFFCVYLISDLTELIYYFYFFFFLRIFEISCVDSAVIYK